MDDPFDDAIYTDADIEMMEAERAAAEEDEDAPANGE